MEEQTPAAPIPAKGEPAKPAAATPEPPPAGDAPEPTGHATVAVAGDEDGSESEKDPSTGGEGATEDPFSEAGDEIPDSDEGADSEDTRS